MEGQQQHNPTGVAACWAGRRWRLPGWGSEARRPQRAGCTGQEAASPQRAGAADSSPEEDRQSRGERGTRAAARGPRGEPRKRGRGLLLGVRGCPARALGDAPGGSQPAVPEPSAAPPPRTASAFPAPALCEPPGVSASAPSWRPSGSVPLPALLRERPRRRGAPTLGPRRRAAGWSSRSRGPGPAASLRARRRDPAGAPGAAGVSRVTWRSGHVPRAGHVRGARGAEPEPARSRETRGGHVTARERSGLT